MNTQPRNVRDTWLHFLSDNLPGVVIWNVRRDTNVVMGTVSASQAQLKINAVNVCFVGDNLRTHISSVVASIDIAYDDELKAVEVVSKLYTILQAAAYTPLLDYSSDTPVSTGGMLIWNPNAVNFKPVADELAYRRTCNLTLQYKTEPVPGLSQPAS